MSYLAQAREALQQAQEEEQRIAMLEAAARAARLRGIPRLAHRAMRRLDAVADRSVRAESGAPSLAHAAIVLACLGRSMILTLDRLVDRLATARAAAALAWNTVRVPGRKRVAAVAVAAMTVTGLAWAAIPHARPPLSTADAWMPLRRPLVIITLSLPDLAVSASSYSGERLGERGVRDTLRLGELAGDGPFVAVSLQRRAPLPAMALAVSAGRLADRDATGDAPIVPVATKFGTFATMDVAVTDGDGARACIAFSRQDIGAQLAIDGLYCGTASVPVDRQIVGCAIDRLELLGGADPAVRAVFVRAERRRNFCGTDDPRGHATRRAWFESGARLPALRTTTLK